MNEQEKQKGIRRYKKNKVKLNKIIKKIVKSWKKNPKDNKTNGGINNWLGKMYLMEVKLIMDL